MSKNTNPNIAGVWQFVEKYYPKYYSSDQIALADDLQKLLGKEINGDAEKMLHRDYNGDINNPKIQTDYDVVHREIYEDAIEAYLETTQKRHYYLFGQDITKEYFDGDFESVLEMAKSNKYDVSIFEWNPADGPGVLLDAADGWMGTADITKEEYEQLLKIKESCKK